MNLRERDDRRRGFHFGRTHPMLRRFGVGSDRVAR
jgi:hypothetical protein